MKPLEMHLRSWTPRRPSPNVERQLFGQRLSRESQPTFRFAWLAPSAVALLLVGLLVSNRAPDGLHATKTPRPIVAVVCSNLSFPSNVIALPIDSLSGSTTQANRLPGDSLNSSLPESNL